MKKAVITVIGHDKVGIIANVSNILAEYNVNILDISQTIMADLFTMIMLTDISASSVKFAELSGKLSDLGEQMGLDIRIAHEDVFNSMHRI